MSTSAKYLDWQNLFALKERSARVHFEELILSVHASYETVDFLFRVDFSQTKNFLEEEEWTIWIMEEFRKAKEFVYRHLNEEGPAESEYFVSDKNILISIVCDSE
ncbi:MAG: hypothetical protein M9962_14255 [Oligoflexia bacterium]|nr:hypothetical protein [Oligoflexia bacterium]